MRRCASTGAPLFILLFGYGSTLAGNSGSGSNLRIPALAVEPTRPMTTLDVLKLRDIGGQTGDFGLSVSPDGRHLAFEMHQADIENNTYRVAWFVASARQPGPAANVGDAGDPELFRFVEETGYAPGFWNPEPPVWYADSSAIAYRRQVDGEVQIWRSTLAGEQQQLTANTANVESFRLSADGSKFLFATDVSRAQKRRAAQAAAGDGYLFTADTPLSFLGVPHIARYALLNGKPIIWAYDIAAQTERLATESEVAEFHSLATTDNSDRTAFGRDARLVSRAKDGRSVAWLAPAFPDKQGMNPPMALYASRSPDGASPTRCAAKECTGYFFGTGADQLWWSEDGRDVYFVTRHGSNLGRRTWWKWNPKLNALKRILHSDDESVRNCTYVHPRAICFRETPIHPRVIAAFDLQAGRVETLVDPNPEIRSLEMGAVERIEWTDVRGRSTYGLLVKPLRRAPGERFPLVIVGYKAFGVIQGGTGHEYPAHVFAANDIGVLIYDAPEDWDVEASVLDYLDRLNRVWGGEAPEVSATHYALQAAIDLLDRRGLVDPKRIGITGFSTGNAQANYALVNSQRFAAASLSGPPWNPIGYYLNQIGPTGRAFYRSIGLGPPAEPGGYFWKKFALSLNIERINTPVLINASDDEHFTGRDTVVSFAEAGKPIIEMHVYPGEAHVKWQPRHRLSVYDRNVDWFNFWLRNVEDANPLKQPQYERWRAIRDILRTKSGRRARH